MSTGIARPPSPTTLVTCALAIAITAALATPLQAQTIHPNKLRGRWTTVSSSIWGGAVGKGTHLALLRGNADTSWVLHFDAHDGEDPRLWLAKPETDDAFGTVLPMADSSRIFCSGHSTLADGRLLVAGGQVLEHSAPKFAFVFDPKRWWEPNSGWTRQKDMLVDRRYASTTLLPNGRVLVTSGQRYFQIVSIGGIDGSDTRLNEASTMALTFPMSWSADPTTTRPPPREGHSTVFDPGSGRAFVFGGQGTTGVRNDLWGLSRIPIDAGERWEWGTWCDTCNVIRPPARTQHSAVISGDTMVVFGGLDAGGAALGDVWRFIRSQNRWLPLATSGGPGPRYGHTAVLVPGRTNAPFPDNVPQMLVFGGRDAAHAMADSTVWALALPPSGDGVWRTIAAGVGPPARAGHAAVLDNLARRYGESINYRRMYVFGGEGRSGLLNDVWVLGRADTATTGAEPWGWSLMATSGTPPPARTRHPMVHDYQFDMLFVFGGDLNGAAAGGRVNDVWALRLQDKPPQWVSLATGDSLPSARSGHTLIIHPTQLLARLPEVFTAADNEQPPCHWDLMNLPRYLQYYPHMFVLRSGKLFFSGNTFDGRSATYDPIADTWSDPQFTAFIGTFSVMFRPDTVLKCGNDVFSAGSQMRIAVIDSATSTATWGPLTSLPEPRAYQNLTLLPTGEVLMTGGRNAQNARTPNPRLWNSRDARTWSDTLAAEPADRQYHSSALLLPDGRVLSSGGLPSEIHATIYWPPYLFNDDGTLATRPVITGLPGGNVVEYGKTFQVDCDSAAAIGIVALMRPGSITHQANFDQRFVRLAFSASSGTRITAMAPPTANHAPPGDYLLFVVKTHSGTTDSIPSVARWVQVAGGVLDVPGPQATAGFALHPSWPNPATGALTLRIDVPRASRVALEVFDLQGRLVRRIADRVFEAGSHRMSWDLEDAAGRRVRAGLYFCRMQSGAFQGRRTVVVLQ